MRVVVLGAGFGGAAVAARLARLRHDVTIVDTADTLTDPDPDRPLGPDPQSGADASASAAATILWLPAVYRDLFISTGRPIEREIELAPVDPARRYVFPDGTVLDLPTGSRAATLDAFGRAFGSVAASEWDTFITAARTRWQELRPALAPPDPDTELRGPSRWRRGRSRSLRAVGAQLGDPRARMVLEWYATAARVDPGRRATGDLAVLPYIEHAFGSWQPVGGWRALHGAVLRRAEARGAAITNARVTAVRAGSSGPTAIDLADKTTLQADVVIDARDRAQPDSADRSAGTAVTIVVACHAVPEGLPAETVLLSPRASGTVVVGRPDLILRPDLITVHAHSVVSPTTGLKELAADVLARTSRIGADLQGDVVAVNRTTEAHIPTIRRPTSRTSSNGLIYHPHDAPARMMRVGGPLGGSAALPMVGLSAALVAALVHAEGSPMLPSAGTSSSGLR